MNKKRRQGAVWIKRIVFIGILVVAGLILTVMYNKYVQRERLEAERQAEAARLERERAEEAARAQRQKEEEEAEKKRREEQEAREKAQREREEAERERARKAAEAEAARQKRIEAENKRREVYNTARDLFKSALGLEGEAPPDEKIFGAKVGSKFWYIFPSHSTDKLIYEVVKVSPSRLEVRTLSPEADAKKVPYVDFIRMRNGNTCVHTSGGNVWLKCEESPEGSYPVPKRGRNFCLAAETIGKMYKTLVELGTNLNDIRYRLTLRSDSGNTNILLGEIGFGDIFPRRAIEAVVGERIGRKASSAIPETSKVEKPTFKRTVVLYNGTKIKKEIDVTKVPRTFTYPPPPGTPGKAGAHQNSTRGRASKRMEEWASRKEFARKKWKKMYDEAVRQERQETRAKEKYRTALALEKKDIERMEVEAAMLSKDSELIDSAMTRCKIVVEVVERK